MAKILLTGASGYIGSHLHRHLQAQGHTVIAVGRQHGHDLSVSGWTHSLPKGPTIVIHAAQSNQYRSFPQGAQDMVAVNIGSTAELLEWSRASGVEHFIFLSTGNVYKPAQHLVDEDHECVPHSMYAASKYSAECLIRQYSSFFQTTVARLFGIYGPQQKSMLIPSMIDRINKGDPITLAQNKGIFLTPLYISDCVALLMKLIEEKRTPSHAIYNLSGAEVLSLFQIVEVIGNHLNKKPQIAVTEGQPQWLCGETKHPEFRLQNSVAFPSGIEKVLATV